LIFWAWLVVGFADEGRRGRDGSEAWIGRLREGWSRGTVSLWEVECLRLCVGEGGFGVVVDGAGGWTLAFVPEVGGGEIIDGFAVPSSVDIMAERGSGGSCAMAALDLGREKTWRCVVAFGGFLARTREWGLPKIYRRKEVSRSLWYQKTTRT
jgi:hypothetical protein